MPLFYIKSAPTALGDFPSSIGESDWSQASWRHPWTPLVGFDVAAEPLQALFGISWLGAKFLLRLCTWLHIFNNGRIKLPWRYRYKSVHVRANSTIGIAEHGKHRQPSCNYQRERGGRCFSCGKGWLVSIDSISRLRKNIYRNLRAPGIYSLHLSLLGSAVPATKGYVGRDAASVGLDNKKKGRWSSCIYCDLNNAEHCLLYRRLCTELFFVLFQPTLWVLLLWKGAVHNPLHAQLTLISRRVHR